MAEDTTFERRCELPVSAQQLYGWHAAEGAFERLTPPFEPAEVLEAEGGIEPGGRAVIRIQAGPLPTKWVAEHFALDPKTLEQRRDGTLGFIDRQVSGPFAMWEHRHVFEPLGERRSALVDSIRYRLPLGVLGRTAAAAFTAKKLDAMFRYRHRTTELDLAGHAAAAAGLAAQGMGRMRVLISGASGLVGRQLTGLLSTGGHEVWSLVRRTPQPGAREVRWSVTDDEIDVAGLEGFDAVVHLAGEPVAQRWSAAVRRRIRDSRVNGTRLLCEALAKLDAKPKALLSTSATGLYGSRGEVVLDESAGRGEGFLADVAVEWEAAAEAARSAGIRVVHPRLGIVLSPQGGALAKTVPLFKLGGGGKLGSGRQWWSWIGIDDVIGGLLHALANPGIEGPMNLVAPEPVTNAEFTRQLARVLRRPAFAPAPAFALKAALGEMADEMLLSSFRVEPAVLEQSGYSFRDPNLEGCLRHVLGR